MPDGKDGQNPHFTSGRDIADVLDRLAAERISDDTRMQCRVCWYIYDPEEGCPEESIPPGTPFRKLPTTFICPDCGHPKTSFLPADDDIG
ncbi:rubredoxin [Sutterella sp.]|uniref:rubredoxin n=1 Tax=Sutterella sp. TaxID=1981025 RepID=UPI0026E03F55|nr:rubredoxin [Sutterella sp.]MDO5530760.1 rubredoxin [Sutterella sp.]